MLLWLINDKQARVESKLMMDYVRCRDPSLSIVDVERNIKIAHRSIQRIRRQQVEVDFF